MFVINEDLSIYLTRGDVANIIVDLADLSGESQVFSDGDIVRFLVFEKNNVSNIVIHKEVSAVNGESSVTISLTTEDSCIGAPINKPKDYWYEIELNPYTHPQTIVGYDVSGAKIFRLFPEGVYKNE